VSPQLAAAVPSVVRKEAMNDYVLNARLAGSPPHEQRAMWWPPFARETHQLKDRPHRRETPCFSALKKPSLRMRQEPPQSPAPRPRKRDSAEKCLSICESRVELLHSSSCHVRKRHLAAAADRAEQNQWNQRSPASAFSLASFGLGPRRGNILGHTSFVGLSGCAWFRGATPSNTNSRTTHKRWSAER